MVASAPRNEGSAVRSRHLEVLRAIGRLVDEAADPRAALEPALDALCAGLGAVRAALVRLDPASGALVTEAARGLSAPQRERGRYRVGEGITGGVVASGAPAYVPDVGREPRFLDRTGVRRGEGGLAFFCVPVKAGGETIGALSVDRRPEEIGRPEDELRVLEIAASMLAGAVRRRQQALEAGRRAAETGPPGLPYRPDNIIGTSKAMQAVYELIAQVAPSDATVLLRGESGVGKELVAHAIHAASPRAGGPFVRVNCAALPQTLLESELFGHERGAFTGAIARRAGRFELAEGGTIFLDEIGDLPPATQVALLRVLQERELERVGGTETIKVDVRVVAATNRDLEALLPDETFRPDLYYRLNVFPIRVPPLRERRTDIPLLADHFVEKYARANNKTVRRISTPAIDMLMSYHWPGNVRELENCIERAVLLTRDEVIHGHHLPPTLQTAEASGTEPRGTLAAAVEAVEREMVVEALKSARGNMAAAARALGITERIMGLRVRKYGIEPRRFKARR